MYKFKDNLTKENVKVGLVIKSNLNPEWGEWRITNHYDDSVWEIHNQSGGRVLFEDEFKTWDIVEIAK